MTRATIATEIGDIEVELYDESAPKAASNFVELAKKGYYDDVIFHRVIPGFVIQGGDGQYGKKADARSAAGWGPAGPATSSRTSRSRATTSVASLAMANSGPNTNGSQFFICTEGPGRQLPKNYTLFGSVTEGLDVVDKIVSAPRDGRDLPNEPVAMTSVTIQASSGDEGKEITQFCMPKPLENGPSQGRISMLLSQPSCPSVKVMGSRVRVVGAADLDAFGAWQKRPPRRLLHRDNIEAAPSGAASSLCPAPDRTAPRLANRAT